MRHARVMWLLRACQALGYGACVPVGYRGVATEMGVPVCKGAIVDGVYGYHTDTPGQPSLSIQRADTESVRYHLVELRPEGSAHYDPPGISACTAFTHLGLIGFLRGITVGVRLSVARLTQP